MKVIILPGNGCIPVRQSNWYGWLYDGLKMPTPTATTPSTDIKTKFQFDPVLRDMPDPHRARRSKWMPFILEELQPQSDTIVVGHSSGAQAAMRLCQDVQVGGLVLVAPCHSDLGDCSEAASGWYPPSGGEWKWKAIRENAGGAVGTRGRRGGNIILLHSTDDPFIPMAEARHVAESLKKNGATTTTDDDYDDDGATAGSDVQLREFDNQSHFFHPSEHILQAVYDVAERIIQC